jgi:hypothetical protein
VFVRVVAFIDRATTSDATLPGRRRPSHHVSAFGPRCLRSVSRSKGGFNCLTVVRVSTGNSFRRRSRSRQISAVFHGRFPKIIGDQAVRELLLEVLKDGFFLRRECHGGFFAHRCGMIVASAAAKNPARL